MQSVFMRANPPVRHSGNSLKSYQQFSQYFAFAGSEPHARKGDFAEIHKNNKRAASGFFLANSDKSIRRKKIGRGGSSRG